MKVWISCVNSVDLTRCQILFPHFKPRMTVEGFQDPACCNLWFRVGSNFSPHLLTYIWGGSWIVSTDDLICRIAQAISNNCSLSILLRLVLWSLPCLTERLPTLEPKSRTKFPYVFSPTREFDLGSMNQCLQDQGFENKTVETLAGLQAFLCITKQIHMSACPFASRNMCFSPHSVRYQSVLPGGCLITLDNHVPRTLRYGLTRGPFVRLNTTLYVPL